MSNKDISTSDIKRLMLQSYRRYKDGEISAAQAKNESLLLTNIFKAVETSETQERLSGIENTLTALWGKEKGDRLTLRDDVKESNRNLRAMLKDFEEVEEEEPTEPLNSLINDEKE